MLIVVLISRDLHAAPIVAVHGFPFLELILQIRSTIKLPPFAAEKRANSGGGRLSPLHKHALMMADKAIIPTWLLPIW